MTRKTVLLLTALLLLLTGCGAGGPASSAPSEKTHHTITYEDVRKTGFPVLQINLEDTEATISKTEKLPALLSLEYDAEEELISEMTIKGRGNSSWSMPKKGYSITFPSKTEVLGMPKHKKWVLTANYTDKSLMRNLYASYLGNTIYNSVWNPSFETVELILNGNYRGTYILGESIKIDKKRVNIPDISDPLSDLKDVNGDGIVDLYDGGFILEINERLDEAHNFRSALGVAFSLKDPDEVTEEIFLHIQGILEHAESVLFSPEFKDPENGYASVFDVDSLIDWYLMNEFAKNKDAQFFSSIYLYYSPADGKIHMGPNWDFDIGYGNHGKSDSGKAKGFWIKDTVWYERLFEDPLFVEKVQTRWNTTKASLLTSITDWIPEKGKELSPTAALNFTRWDILGRPVWPYASGFLRRLTYSSEVDFLQSWLLQRYTWLDEALNSL